MTGCIACSVPFCRRSRRNDHGWAEWLCETHWRLIPKAMRRVHGRIRGRHRRGHFIDGTRADRVWRRLKRQAIEAAAGIGT